MNEMSYSHVMYRNVVYKEYLDYNVLELGECAKDFIELAGSYGLNKDGPLILVYTQFMKDNQANVTLMMPVDMPFAPGDDLGFRTYLYIDQMLEGRLKTKQYEKEEKQVLTEIENFAKLNNLKRVSPYYHIINEIDDMSWVDIKVKVMEE